MNLKEIKTAVRNGEKVYYQSALYEVILSHFKSGEENWLIKSSNGHAIGLTWADDITLNGKEAYFFTNKTQTINK